MENQVTGNQEFTPNTHNMIKNCLFYNNMTNVFNENYRYDITVFNPNNESFTVMDNTFYFREKTAGNATVNINDKISGKYRPVGPQTEGFSMGRNKMICSSDMPTLDEVIEELGMEASSMSILPVDKIWYNYTDEGLLETEIQDTNETESLSETETVNETESVSDTVETDGKSENVQTESDITEESSTVSESDSSSGCGSFVGGAAVSAASAAALGSLPFISRKSKKSE